MTENAPQPWDQGLRFDAVDLVHRTGMHRHVDRTVTAVATDETPAAMHVRPGRSVEVEAELESVVEGIYVHGTVTAELDGECSRCLDPVTQDITARLDELFMYPEKIDQDDEDVTVLEGDVVDLGPLVHDALALAADDRPLCDPECPGLCGQCGVRLEEDPEHHHDVIDDRWAALQGLFGATGGEQAGAETTGHGQGERA